jgi:hypothetical protein
MVELLLVVLLVLGLYYLLSNCKDNNEEYMLNNNMLNNNMGYVSNPSAKSNTVQESRTYNDVLKSVALEPGIQDSHNEFLDSLNLTWTPLNASEKSDCLDINGRLGLFPVDYRNKMDFNQNIPIPETSCSVTSNNQRNRWGGYGYSSCRD